MISNPPPSMLNLITGNDSVKPDVTFVVENRKLSAHRHYLSLISPVFKAMFETDSAEAKTARVTITDFTAKTWENALFYIYGEPLPYVSIQELLEIYKFVDKYDITAARRLAPSFEQEINNTNFCTISKFAWMYSDEHIMKKCVAFLASHSNLTLTTDFNELDQRLILELLRKASDIASNRPKGVRYTPLIVDYIPLQQL
uniref:BTB domain-containing protein n=1 Tax=Panagrellus redivivus TaxID=6233 RepID=A0A7E4UPN5_PANRE